MALSTPVLIAIVATRLVVPAGEFCPTSPGAGPPPVASVVCGAARPAVGDRFEGPVLHVFDGRTLCIAQGPTPSEWIRVELEDGGPGGRSALMAAAFAKQVICVADRADHDGVIARCFLGDVSLGWLTEDPAVRVEAAAWR